jgi:hypothetical protein
MQGRFKMEYRLFNIVRYNYRDYNSYVKNPVRSQITGQSTSVIDTSNDLDHLY